MKVILLAVASVVLLAGCTATPDPTPTPTTAECTPATAEFTWEHGAQSTLNRPVGVQILTYSEAGTVRTLDARNIPADAFIQDADALNMLTDFDQDENVEWIAALLADLQRTGQVSEKFNSNPDLSEKPLTEPEKPKDGKYIVSVASPQVTVPFSISCDGEVVAESALTSSDSFGFASTIYRCGEDVGEDPTALAALEYCS